jgi:hypothetical protein
MRVTAQLINAENAAHIWSERWDRPAADVFTVQTEIAQQVVNPLGGSGGIMEAEHRAAQRKRPEGLGAYETYLLGRDRILTPTKQRIDEAIALFKRALQKGPTLARAWVDLAWAYDQSIGYGVDYGTTHPFGVERCLMQWTLALIRCWGHLLERRGISLRPRQSLTLPGA